MAPSNDPDPRSILVVLPTWVGDFVMATPALRAVRRRFASAHVVFLAEPNLRDVVRGGDWMNEVVFWPIKSKRSILHRDYRDLVWELRRRRFDWAVLLPNSFRSALLARLIGAKRRIGYDRDGRGRLLTDRIPARNRGGVNVHSSLWQKVWHGFSTRVFTGYKPVPHESQSNLSRADSVRKRPQAGELGGAARTVARDSQRGFDEVKPDGARIWRGPEVAVRMGARLPASLGPFLPMPMVEYYADLIESIGCERPGDQLELFVTPDCEESLAGRLAECGVGEADTLVVISPGAKFGASKCWMSEGFAAVADRLIELKGAKAIITCGPGEEPIARQIGAAMRREGLVWDTPLLSLGELKSLIRRCDLLICNDAGPRHFAKAFGVPVVTLFGPTHPDWTATSYADERIVRTDIDCGPCQQKICPLGHHQCMTAITPEIVYQAAAELLQRRAESHQSGSREHVHG